MNNRTVHVELLNGQMVYSIFAAMENKDTKSIFSIAFPYAGILALVMAVITLVFYLTGLTYLWGGSIAYVLKGILFFVTFIVVLVVWRKNTLVVTYKRALAVGSIVVAGYVIMIAIFDYLFFAFIAPDFYHELRDHTLQMMIDYNVPEAQINETVEQFDKGEADATPVKMTLNWAIVRLLCDLILLLLVAIFLRKKAQEPTSINIPL